MTVVRTLVYASSNGDRWYLCRGENVEDVFVLHQPMSTARQYQSWTVSPDTRCHRSGISISISAGGGTRPTNPPLARIASKSRLAMRMSPSLT